MKLLDVLTKQSNLPAAYFLNMSLLAQRKYRTYRIDKVGGGSRIIEHPAKELKFVQRWLAKRVFTRFPVHSCAYAYVKGKSIANNAERHRQNRFLLKIDFRDFFPSIKVIDIARLLEGFRYMDGTPLGADEVQFITAIVTRSGGLVIGSPSSPIISNVIMHDFDVRWAAYSEARSLIYTRYADDLYFSTNEPNVLQQCLEDMRLYLARDCLLRLRINDSKVVHTSSKRRRVITGLNITSQGTISVGRARKRMIKALIHRSLTAPNAETEGRVRGLLTYVNSVEPSFITALRTKYGAIEIRRFIGR